MGGRGAGVEIDLLGDELIGDGTAKPEDVDKGLFEPDVKDGHSQALRSMEQKMRHMGKKWKTVDGETKDEAKERAEHNRTFANKETLLVMDDQGEVKAAVIGTKNAVAPTPKAKRVMKGNDITHLHPRSDVKERGFVGGCFSYADLRNGLAWGGSSFGAVGDEGTYRIVEGDNVNHFAMVKDYERKAKVWQKDMHSIDRETENEGRANGWSREKRRAESFNRQMAFLWDKEQDLLKKHGYYTSFRENPTYQKTNFF